MIELFIKNNGYATMAYLKQNKIHSSEIKSSLDDGIIEKVKSGLYKLVDFPWDENSSYLDICKANSKAVICLVSAAEYYGLTVLNPSKVTVAIPRLSKFNKLLFPPVKIYYFNENFYNLGIQEVSTSGGEFLIYSIEKTIVDLFRYQTKIGDDIVIEVLKNYLGKQERDINLLLKYAQKCGTVKKITPYLTALTV
jgi:predicted transcriptional regulator of viral defense system